MTNMTNTYTARIAAAETAYKDFEFDEGFSPEASGDWEHDLFGNFTRVIFLPEAEDASTDTVNGQFIVSFPADSLVPLQVWATLKDKDIGHRPASARGKEAW